MRENRSQFDASCRDLAKFAWAMGAILFALTAAHAKTNHDPGVNYASRTASYVVIETTDGVRAGLRDAHLTFQPAVLQPALQRRGF